MITKEDFSYVCNKSLAMIEAAGIKLSVTEKEKITAADFGLGSIKEEGVQVLTLFDTDRMAAKILILLPFQTLPEHWHPPIKEDPGKEELIRGIWGDLNCYIPGENTRKVGFIISGKEAYYTMRNEVVIKPGEQLLLAPGTKHWFQAGKRGAVMYSFSTKVTDLMDEFSDPEIVRETIIER